MTTARPTAPTDDPIPDAAVRLAASLAGNAQDFAPLVAHFERPVFAFLGRMGFDRATCADLAQDTFVRAWRFRASHDAARGSIAAWVFGIARNVALNEYRRAGRRPTTSIDAVAVDTLAAPDDASDAAERMQQRDRLHRALQRLDDTDRTTIALSYVQGLSAPEAAALAGCRPDAYRARLSRARRRLTALLESDT